MAPYKTCLSLAFCGLLLLSACDKKEAPPSAASPMVHGPSVRIYGLKGKVFAYVDRHTSAGYVYTQTLFAAAQG